LVSIIDITDYEESSFKDELTGLFNRKILTKAIKSFTNEKKCVIIFDIDDFKQVNDTYGHLMGDEVLKTVAKASSSVLRKKDLNIRWGGEEFLIILDGVSSQENLFKIAESLRERIKSQYIKDAGNITCSFGVACDFIASADDFHALIEKADKALYMAKRDGKDKTIVYQKGC
jgi:diguanylate cyclase (GGDEF)-like protein